MTLTLPGADGINIITGSDGDDIIQGLGGNDTSYAATDASTLRTTLSSHATFDLTPETITELIVVGVTADCQTLKMCQKVTAS